MEEEREFTITDMSDAFEDCLLGYPDDSIALLVALKDADLNLVYKASKQLGDLCWQEIKRRREK